MDGFQDADGCPDLDNDGDGIPDIRDGCPDEPETMNGFQDEDGCPDQTVTLPSVAIPFASGSATLPGSGAYAGLDPVEAALRANSGLRLEIQGYTDSVGDEGANLRLSTRRAEAVMADLVARGIDPGRLRVRGFGEAHPVASNDTAAGRALNRRIEFVPWEP
jgi:outer membrane protein OmpA-like peptidoglycan-associated protein